MALVDLDVTVRSMTQIIKKFSTLIDHDPDINSITYGVPLGDNCYQCSICSVVSFSFSCRGTRHRPVVFLSMIKFLLFHGLLADSRKFYTRF